MIIYTYGYTLLVFFLAQFLYKEMKGLVFGMMIYLDHQLKQLDFGHNQEIFYNFGAILSNEMT